MGSVVQAQPAVTVPPSVEARDVGVDEHGVVVHVEEVTMVRLVGVAVADHAVVGVHVARGLDHQREGVVPPRVYQQSGVPERERAAILYRHVSTDDHRVAAVLQVGVDDPVTGDVDVGGLGLPAEDDGHPDDGQHGTH